MNIKIKRGDIFLANLSPVLGCEQDGIRPVLLIQNDTGNKHSQTVIVAVITSKTYSKTPLPTHVLLRAKHGLEKNSLVLLEQIRTIDKCRIGEYIGTLDERTMKRVNMALAISVGIGG